MELGPGKENPWFVVWYTPVLRQVGPLCFSGDTLADCNKVAGQSCLNKYFKGARTFLLEREGSDCKLLNFGPKAYRARMHTLP